MPYLVTGSHGCIGAWVLEALVDRGERRLDTRELA